MGLQYTSADAQGPHMSGIALFPSSSSFSALIRISHNTQAPEHKARERRGEEKERREEGGRGRCVLWPCLQARPGDGRKSMAAQATVTVKDVGATSAWLE